MKLKTEVIDGIEYTGTEETLQALRESEATPAEKAVFGVMAEWLKHCHSCAECDRGDTTCPAGRAIRHKMDRKMGALPT